jgi:hypothetical protein
MGWRNLVRFSLEGRGKNETLKAEEAALNHLPADILSIYDSGDVSGLPTMGVGIVKELDI